MVFVSYVEYLTTTGWRVRAWNAKAAAGWVCQECGSDGPLEVHHLNYARVGHERDEDLIVLCDECHARRHGLLDDDQLLLPYSNKVH